MVYEKVREKLSEQLEKDINSISADTNIVDDLGADSLDLVELIMALEDEYGITLTDEAMYDNKTVGDIAKFIESQLGSV